MSEYFFWPGNGAIKADLAEAGWADSEGLLARCFVAEEDDS